MRKLTSAQILPPSVLPSSSQPWASQSSVDAVAAQLGQLAAQMEQIRLQGAQQTQAGTQLAAQVARTQERMDNPLGGNFAGGAPQHIVAAESWVLEPPSNVDLDGPIAVRECAAMVQEALQNKVAPAMGASLGALAAEIGSTNLRVDNLEAEVRVLKLHIAWTERNLLSSQVEQAKRAIVCRNFPEWSSSQDKEATIKYAFTEAGLHIEGGPQLWELATQRLVGDDGKESLSAISILTVPNLTFRQKALQACNRIRPRYVEDPQPDSPTEKQPDDNMGYYAAKAGGSAPSSQAGP